MQFHLKRGNITLELTSSPEWGEFEKYGKGGRMWLQKERWEKPAPEREKYEKYQKIYRNIFGILAEIHLIF